MNWHQIAMLSSDSYPDDFTRDGPDRVEVITICVDHDCMAFDISPWKLVRVWVSTIVFVNDARRLDMCCEFLRASVIPRRLELNIRTVANSASLFPLY